MLKATRLQQGAALSPAARCPGGVAARQSAIARPGRPAITLLCRSSAAPAPAASTTDAQQAWARFAAAVAGEFDGVTASFTPEGEPMPLPEYYVPGAYREWGVVLTDWQSQSSMNAAGGVLRAVSRRMMPTVGCEADAIAFTEEEQQMFVAGREDATVAPDGSYSHGPLDISASDLTAAAFQHCLPLGGGERLRLVHKLQRLGADARWQLAEVELHRERYDGPWTGKLELSGCGGGLGEFASSARLEAEAVTGAWTGTGVRHQVTADGGSATTSAVAGQPWSMDRLPAAPVYLPLRVWSSTVVEGDAVSIAVGALRQDGSMALATRQLVPGQGTTVELLNLQKS